jgi:hypothetical protein
MGISRRARRLLPGRRRRQLREHRERPALLELPRFRLSAVAILKNEAAYLEEWLCHHMAVGVEHFFLYDNGSTDDYHALITPYVNHGIVTTVFFPMRGGQRDAYNHALRCFGGTSAWMAFVDIDEFLVPVADEPVPDILARGPEAEQVLVCRREFCFGGHRERPNGLLTEEYRLVSENVPRLGMYQAHGTARSSILAKAIVRPSGVHRVGVHAVTTVSGRTVDTAGRPAPEGRPPDDPTYDHLLINHYYTKSWAEFQVKLARTNTSTHSFQLPAVPFDIPGEPDLTVQRWVPRTKALIEEMRMLAPAPYRYGSRLRVPGFPISDQFPVLAITMLSNEVAGIERPRKQREFNSLPVPGVRGALAGADSHGYVCAPGKLRDSVHAAQALGWLGAEIAWDLVASGTGDEAEDASLTRTPAGAWQLALGDPPGGIVMPEAGPALRCHALLCALRVPGAASLTLDVDEGDGAWQPTLSVPIPEAGSYLGFFAADKRPRTLGRVRVRLAGVGSAEIYDLALLTFG